jgi:hypothetical protein
MLLPDTVGTGGDSHTRFPLGISFPAGSGLVAFAAALGAMPLDMPESVLVRFTGELQPGVTLRDVVNAIPYVAMQKKSSTANPQSPPSCGFVPPPAWTNPNSKPKVCTPSSMLLAHGQKCRDAASVWAIRACTADNATVFSTSTRKILLATKQHQLSDNWFHTK